MIRRSGNRFADKIMRQINELAREPQISLRNLRKLDCAAKPVPTPDQVRGRLFADRALEVFAVQFSN
jgi:hypothetical protein